MIEYDVTDRYLEHLERPETLAAYEINNFSTASFLAGIIVQEEIEEEKNDMLLYTQLLAKYPHLSQPPPTDEALFY